LAQLLVLCDRAVLLFQPVRGLLINVANHGVVKKAAVRMVYRDGLLQIVVIGLSVNRSPVTEQKMKAGGASAYGGTASSGRFTKREANECPF
jgi:hypothetical protein